MTSQLPWQLRGDTIFRFILPPLPSISMHSAYLADPTYSMLSEPPRLPTPPPLPRYFTMVAFHFAYNRWAVEHRSSVTTQSERLPHPHQRSHDKGQPGLLLPRRFSPHRFHARSSSAAYVTVHYASRTIQRLRMSSSPHRLGALTDQRPRYSAPTANALDGCPNTSSSAVSKKPSSDG